MFSKLVLPNPHPDIQQLDPNPKDLTTNVLWQIDVTHIQLFGKQKFVFITIDTYSYFTLAQINKNFKKLIT